MESPRRAIHQNLIDLGINAETVGRADDVKLQSLEHLLSFAPERLSSENSEAFRSVKCELCWLLGIIGFDEAVSCIDKNSKIPAKLDEEFLVNAFADRHAFELGKIAVGGGSHVEDETELERHAKSLISWAGSLSKDKAPYIFLQHSLRLLKRNPGSRERQDMFKNMMTLHMSSYAAENLKEGAIGAIYAELRVDVPTLFYAKLARTRSSCCCHPSLERHL